MANDATTRGFGGQDVQDTRQAQIGRTDQPSQPAQPEPKADAPTGDDDQ